MTAEVKLARMTIDLSKEAHKKLKAIAAISGISMRELVLQAVDRYLQTDTITASLTLLSNDIHHSAKVDAQ